MNSIIEFATARHRIVLWSKFAALAALAGLLSSPFIPEMPFEGRLAVWFAFWVFAFHWFFGQARSLTVTHLRLVDYVYLGVAAAGLFVLTLNYGEKRNAYLTAEEQQKWQEEIEGTRTEVRMAAEDVVNEACKPTTVNAFPDYCGHARAMSSVLHGNYTADEIDGVLKRYSYEVVQLRLSERDNSKVLEPLEIKNDRVQKLGRTLILAMRFAQLQEPLPPDPREYAFGLFTWPFILSFALALRLTKTTVEILEWTTEAESEVQTRV